MRIINFLININSIEKYHIENDVKIKNFTIVIHEHIILSNQYI